MTSLILLNTSQKNILLRENSNVTSLLKNSTLRISVLEQCMSHCPYCLPGKVTSFSKRKQWLTAEEHNQLAPFFKVISPRKIRFTGGEPLIRKDLEDIIKIYAAHFPQAESALTTNAVLLDETRMKSLAKAGLQKLSIHIDSLDQERYKELMGNDIEVSNIIKRIILAKKYFSEVKLNAVILKNKNLSEIKNFLDFSIQHKIQVRFIELMNTGSAKTFVHDNFISGADIKQAIQKVHPFTHSNRDHPSDPSSLYTLKDDSSTRFGIIASDTESFCEDCDRLRLTATGHLRGCLYQSGGIPLGAALRAQKSAEHIQEMVLKGIQNKKSHHPDADTNNVPFSMSEIGG